MRLYYKIKDMKKVFLLAFVLFAWSMVVNAQESDGKYIEPRRSPPAGRIPSTSLLCGYSQPSVPPGMH